MPKILFSVKLSNLNEGEEEVKLELKNFPNVYNLLLTNGRLPTG